jgi:hypothetical protein
MTGKTWLQIGHTLCVSTTGRLWSIKRHEGLRIFREEDLPGLQEQPLTGNALPKLSLDPGPKCKQKSVPNSPRFILSMDMILP